MSDVSEKKERACQLARNILGGSSYYLECVNELLEIGNALYGQVWNTEFHVFGVIASETDHLSLLLSPELCSEASLAKMKVELKECARLYKPSVSEACNAILANHGNA